MTRPSVFVLPYLSSNLYFLVIFGGISKTTEIGFIFACPEPAERMKIAVPLYPFLTAEFQYSSYSGRSISLWCSCAFVSCKHKISGWYFSMNGIKSPFLCTARIPFTFQEIIFILLFVVKLLVYISQVLVCYMSINLCGADVGMAEHGLHGTQIRSVTKQIGGENMANDMRSHFFGYAGDSGISFYNSFDRATGQTLPNPSLRRAGRILSP